MVENAGVSEHVRRSLLTAVLVVALVAFAFYVWGGYDEGWAWTGLSSQVTMWDWLEGLALPVTVGLVPLLLRHRDHLGPTHRTAGLAVLLAFAALVLAGYLLPMRWTGFTGNTLWDWLSLALLPLVIATSTLWHPPPEWSARHVLLVTGAAVLAVLLVLAGYLVPWAWTGFTGNTAWDWIKLLLLPLLLPTLVMPRLLKAAEAWMSPVSAAPLNSSQDRPPTAESAPADH
jgi:magnesium-transporting ATPase (P-type)